MPRIRRGTSQSDPSGACREKNSAVNLEVMHFDQTNLLKHRGTSFSRERQEVVTEVGIEAGVSGGFSIRAEYLYMQVNDIGGSAPVPFGLGGGTITETAKIQDSIFRIGGNYRF